MSRDDEDLFAGWRPAAPPPRLEERVLAAAREGRAPRARRLEDRLWTSRWARLGWLGACAVLLAVNLLLPGPGGAKGSQWQARGEAAARPPAMSQPRASGGSPRWSDQRMLLCRLLGDCGAAEGAPVHGTPGRPRTDGPHRGGKA